MMTTKENSYYHIPVMLKPCIDGLNIHPDGTYVDVTFGGGGHSREIFKYLTPKGRLISFDQDKEAQLNAWKADNFFFVSSNFSFLKNHLLGLGISKVDGILADLGVSSYQFNEKGKRGFSYRYDDPLDMRMNQKQTFSALQVVNEYTEEQLATIFGRYGEVEKPMRLAIQITKERSKKELKSTYDLVNAISLLAPRNKENKYLAQVFQAIRIEVNNEMETLEKMLLQTVDVLKPEGRLVVMSYHSLEDRMVKNFFKRGHFDGKIEKDFYGNVLKPFKEVVRKPIVPTEEELEDNPRARSAKLRIAERI